MSCLITCYLLTPSLQGVCPSPLAGVPFGGETAKTQLCLPAARSQPSQPPAPAWPRSAALGWALTLEGAQGSAVAVGLLCGQGASGRERGWEQRGRLSPVSCHVGECTGCLSSLKDALKGPVTHTYPFKSGILLSVCLNSNCHTKANIQSY